MELLISKKIQSALMNIAVWELWEPLEAVWEAWEAWEASLVLKLLQRASQKFLLSNKASLLALLRAGELLMEA